MADDQKDKCLGTNSEVKVGSPLVIADGECLHCVITSAVTQWLERRKYDERGESTAEPVVVGLTSVLGDVIHSAPDHVRGPALAKVFQELVERLNFLAAEDGTGDHLEMQIVSSTPETRH